MKILFSTLAITAFAFTVRANSIVFSSFGPSDSFNQTNSYAVETIGRQEELAAQFTAGASGKIATVDLAIAAVAPPFGFFPLDVYLYGEAGGVPDTTHQTLLSQIFLLSTFNFPTIISFNVTGTVSVNAGSVYWLSLKPPSENEFFLWAKSSPQISGGVDFQINDGNWSPFGLPGSPLPAFRLTASSTVPDSGATGLLMLFSVSLVGMMRHAFASKYLTTNQ